MYLTLNPKLLWQKCSAYIMTKPINANRRERCPCPCPCPLWIFIVGCVEWCLLRSRVLPNKAKNQRLHFKGAPTAQAHIWDVFKCSLLEKRRNVCWQLHLKSPLSHVSMVTEGSKKNLHVRLEIIPVGRIEQLRNKNQFKQENFMFTLKNTQNRHPAILPADHQGR